MKFRNAAGAVLALAAAAAILMTAGAVVASAAPEHSGQHGRGVPTSKISIQLYTFSGYIGSGSDAAAQARLEEVLRRLSRMGYRNVEPYSFHGLTAKQFRALLAKYRLRASAEHTSIDEANWEQTLADARTIGVKYLGAGATPSNFTTAQQWIDYARMLNRLGKRARSQGLSLMVHNHNWDFTQTFGGLRAYDILMEHTDPRYVVFQLDLYWAVTGGADPVEVIRRYGHRIKLFHVKDRGVGGRIEIVGEGSIDFPRIFRAAGGGIDYYAVEHDPPGDRSFDPFEAAQKGFTYLDRLRF
jgi:sugar phosphate isomerase/epimerase